MHAVGVNKKEEGAQEHGMGHRPDWVDRRVGDGHFAVHPAGAADRAGGQRG